MSKPIPELIQLLEEAQGENFSRIFGYAADRNTKGHLEALITTCKKDYENAAFNSIDCEDCFKQTVRGYQSSKEKLIETCRKFTDYIERKYGISLKIKFPDIDVSNRMERMFYIAKATQENEKSLAEIADELWISPEQIGKDYNALTGVDQENAIKVCGKLFTIENTSRSRGHISYESTAHPIFFGANISEVMATLKGFRQMESDPNSLMAAGAKNMAVNMWNQLSPYCRKRVIEVFRIRYGDSDTAQWCYELGNKRIDDSHHFVTERNLSYRSNNPMRHNLELSCKTLKICEIEYEDIYGNIKTINDCKIANIEGDICIVEHGGDTLKLEIKKIRSLK